VEPQPRSKSSRVLLKLIISVLLFAFASWLFLNRQFVIDQVAVWQFQPSSEVTALRQRATMTDRGQFYFYASHPEVQDRTEFNKSCNSLKTQETVVLGCYSARSIYLFNVNDPTLEGIKEVTAAHEMLHAAYDRLSPNERDRVNKLLDTAAKNVNNPSLQDLLKEYDKTEPGERLNELHSILGTQVANLGSDLETYYKQYFTNRQAVVAMSQKYESVFNNLKTQQGQLASELEQLATALAAESNSYNQSITKLNTDIASFNARAAAGNFSSQSQFNTQRNQLVAQQEQLRQTQNNLNAKIAQYNEKRAALEAINSQAEALNRSINSNLSPVPTL
jgi:predicted  nucleic acid-binding Zn-ribbon protein